MTSHPVVAFDDLPEGTNRAFDVGGRSVLVCRTKSGVFAVENMCSHALAHLEGGKMKGVHLFCPLHGVRFDMRTGEPSGTLTKKPIPVYPAQVDGGTIMVDLPDGA